LEAALAYSSGVPTSVRAKVLFAAGSFAAQQGDYSHARARLETSLSLWQELNDAIGMAWVLNDLGNVTYRQGDVARAATLFEQSLTLKRTVGHTGDVAVALNNLGYIALSQGDYPRAHALLEESLRLAREQGDMPLCSQALTNLGLMRLLQHQADADRLFAESLVLAHDQGDQLLSAQCLIGLAGVAVRQGQAARAAQLLGAVATFQDITSIAFDALERAEYERAVAAARTQLGEAAFTSAWSTGRAMTLEQAIAYAGTDDTSR
jgi:tetratricopeptide (TPR) repeat protein